MKRSLVLLVLAGIASTALAHPPMAAPCGGGHLRARMHHFEHWRMHQLTVLLDLTAAQQKQVKAILHEEHAQMRHTFRHEMEQMRAEHKAMHEATVAKLGKVLSAEQMAKFKLLTPRGPMFIRHHMSRSGPAPGSP